MCWLMPLLPPVMKAVRPASKPEVKMSGMGSL
jgi:hypothetical protein